MEDKRPQAEIRSGDVPIEEKLRGGQPRSFDHVESGHKNLSNSLFKATPLSVPFLRSADSEEW
ncbi:hypothetical protein QQP08_011918 [Theobroma cacao]|nr:hypothetical protein QQP08_011918 [Theobroma cacao]